MTRTMGEKKTFFALIILGILLRVLVLKNMGMIGSFISFVIIIFAVGIWLDWWDFSLFGFYPDSDISWLKKSDEFDRIQKIIKKHPLLKKN